MQTQTAIKSALLGLLAVGTLGVAGTAAASDNAMGAHNMQKCYGVNAANKNDCNTPGHSCAGTDSKARDPNAYVSMPAGLCEKLAGGSLKPANGMMKQDSMKHDSMKKGGMMKSGEGMKQG